MLGGVLNIRVDEEGVSFGVDVFHHNLETIEAARLRHLNFIREMLVEVLIDDAVGGCEEGEDMRNEVTLVVVETVVPVVNVFGQVHLFSRPKGRLDFLVHLPILIRTC